MRTTSRIASAAFALAIAASGFAEASAAYYSPFARYFDEAPDFTIEQAYQYDNSDTYLVRVCNRGNTPVNGGTLRVAVGRTANDRQERNFSGVAPAAGTCSNVELPNVRQYGRKENRTYGLIASVAWNGSTPESSLTNNSKNVAASPTMKSGGSVSTSWTAPTTSRKTYQDPVSDLYLDRGTNPYAGRTWYYSNGGSYDCGGYWNGNSWRPYSRYVSDYATDDRNYSNNYSYRDSDYSNYSYSVDSHCYDKYVPGTSGYYWGGSSNSSNSSYYSNNGTDGSYYSNNGYNGSSYAIDGTTYYSNGNVYYTNGGNVYYNGSTYYDPTANQYYAQNQYSNANFYVTRVGRDGGARNVLATVCNNGADMSQFKDLSIGFKDLSKNTSFRATQYVKLLSGQCRDVSVNFSSFAIDFSGVHTFEVTVDPDNRFAERDENDNSLKADIFVNN